MISVGTNVLCVRPNWATDGKVVVGNTYTVGGNTLRAFRLTKGRQIEALAVGVGYWVAKDCFVSLPDEIDRRGK